MEINKNEKEYWNYCYTSMEACTHSRRCFMTGEYCSKQPNIQRERKKMHAAQKFRIKAFVVMNFSDMSDVVYKWRIRPFIESLSKYLYFKEDKLYCSVSEKDVECNENNRVKEIEVVRSDSDPASNYVVCSRICQQMQIADLIIVDVSSQNANVFYEFGMAVALGKMILPICYSESFYKRVIPNELEETWNKDRQKWIENEEQQKKIDQEREEIDHHIGLYPWRKDLFEYYGIRYKNSDPQTKYIDFNKVKNPVYGFSDIQYSRFPYHETLQGQKETTGEVIYNLLKGEYNDAEPDANTLVVYTMDAFLNEEQAGRCIVNFYHNIVKRMKTEKCFCGERVGVLVQGNVISESEKDAKESLDIEYSVGEIIQIGTNQATYLAAEEKIKSDDNWSDMLEYTKNADGDKTVPTETQRKDMERFIKNHITNRAMRIYPNNPVFVDRMKNLLHKDLLTPIDGAFYLYYVMLRTLRHTNEIVVDVSNNCLQSLFWLGAAHGSDIHAITVMHEKRNKESKYEAKESEKEHRFVFDVAGLWMAILRKNDTEGFYSQLAAAQSGIERHSKLMLSNSEYGYYKKQLKEYLFAFNKEFNDERFSIDKLNKEKNAEECKILESYYRDRFWTPMLGYNQLSIYLSHRNDRGVGEEPRLCMSKWDFDTIAVLSQYLSRRKIIGEYSLVSAIEREEDSNAKKRNFICVGSESQPLKTCFSHYIYEQIKDASPKFKDRENVNIIHERRIFPGENEPPIRKRFCTECRKYFKGFARIEKIESDTVIYSNSGIYTHQPKTQTCANCSQLKGTGDSTKIYFDKEDVKKEEDCSFAKTGRHTEIAQLILWRENPKESDERCYFRVGIIGSSGPATFALSSLFVSEEQREKAFAYEKAESKNDNLLCELQSIARQKFVEIFLHDLDEGIKQVLQESENDIEEAKEQKKKYRRLVKHAVIFYFKTVLYRYFVPFLSETDIERIYSGMYTFINSMKAARVSPFALNYDSDEKKSCASNDDSDEKKSCASNDDFDEKKSCVSNDKIEEIVNEIPEVLRNTLKSFRGLEAFYQIDVEHTLEDPETIKDNRRVKGIQLVKTKDRMNPCVNFFFI